MEVCRLGDVVTEWDVVNESVTTIHYTVGDVVTEWDVVLKWKCDNYTVGDVVTAWDVVLTWKFDD